MYVLVVEDVRLAREIAAAVAQSAVEDAVVMTAADLAQGLAAGHSMPRVDLMLLDPGLPGCSGVEALVRFKQAFPAAKIIVISANDSPEFMRDALRAGADAFVAKARIPGDLFAAIGAVAAPQARSA